MPTFYKILAAAALIPLAGILVLTIAFKIYLPPQKVRQLVVEAAGKQLHREVRLKSVALGPIKGLVLEGLEVSEKPDFKAGTFAAIESFRFRIQWLPILRKKVVIDEISLSGPSVAVTQIKPGVFNFSDLVAASTAPAVSAPRPGAAEPGATFPFELRAGHVSLNKGLISYKDSGAQWRLSDIKAVLTGLSLSQPFGVEAGFKAQQLAPGSLGARAELDGRVDLSGLSNGRIFADIRKLSADVSGLGLSLAGKVQVTPERIDIPELKGRFGDGSLVIKASVLDYSRAPDARLDVELSALDAGQLLAVAAAAGPAAPAQGKSSAKLAAKPAATRPGQSGPPVKTSGKVAIGKMLYRTLRAKDLGLTWDLKGITPDLRGLSGWAKLKAFDGSFEAEEKAAGQSKLVQALLIPLSVLKRLGSLGGVLKILPSFDRIAFSEIVGDYVFERGVMTIRDFHMKSLAANVATGGSIDLPGQKLNLQMTIAVAKIAPIGVDVGGTFEEPKIRPRLTKDMVDPVKKIAEPALDLFKGLFKKK